MTKLEKLYELAKKENIIIKYTELQSMGLLGLNVNKEGLPSIIFLDYSIKNDYYTHLEVFSEELGHYFTTSGKFVSVDTYKNKLLNAKCENKALKWACEFLISEDEIIDLVNKNLFIEDIYEELEVSKYILDKRLEYLALKKQTIYLGNNKYLVLTNLPNIYIHTKFEYNI